MSDLRAICEAATPGPWEFASVAGVRFGSLDGGPEDDRHAVLYFDDVPDVPHAGNRRYIETFNPERVSKMLERDEQFERVREKARAARSAAAAPDYDEEAIRDALWAVVDAALHESEDE